MQVELLNDQGQAASNVDVPETVFGRDYNEAPVSYTHLTLPTSDLV